MLWKHEFSTFLSSLGFLRSKHDYSLFVKSIGENFIAALVYIDDVLLTDTYEEEISNTKLALDRKFTIKDLGLARYYLGIKFCKTSSSTMLH